MAKTAIIFVSESGPLETMAILLAKSIKYSHQVSEVDQYCFSPRRFAKISKESFRILTELGVNVIDDNLNSQFVFQPMANKILATAYMEKHFHSHFDQLIFLDTDTLVLQDITNSSSLPMAAKPDDLHNMAPKDNLFWKLILERCGVKFEQLTWNVTSTVSNKQMIPYFNSGVIIKNGDNEFFQHWGDNYQRTVCDRRVFDLSNRELYFLEQAVFSATILSMFNSEQIQLLDNHMNYPLHKIKPKRSELDGIRVIHYHDQLSKSDWNSILQISEEQFPWIYESLPFKHGKKKPLLRLTEILNYQIHKLKYK